MFLFIKLNIFYIHHYILNKFFTKQLKIYKSNNFYFYSIYLMKLNQFYIILVNSIFNEPIYNEFIIDKKYKNQTLYN